MQYTEGHALIIGIGSYPHFPQAGVPIAVSDAKAVYDVLTNQQWCAYPPEQVALLRNSQATRKGILHALNVLKKIPQSHFVLLFYSGHGDYSTDGKYFLTTYDTQIVNGKVVRETGISEDELLTCLGNIHTTRLAVIINACYSGAISESSQMASFRLESGGPHPSKEAVERILTSGGAGEGRLVITAAQENQKSYFLPATDRLTLFGQAVIAALQDKGCVVDGQISALKFAAAVDSVVKKVAKSRNLEQTPYSTFSGGDFSIGPNLQAQIDSSAPALVADTQQSSVYVVRPQPLYRPSPFRDCLVGRADLLNQIKRNLFKHGVHSDWLVLHGRLGIGKRALLLSLVYDAEVERFFKGGILWADLGRQGDVLSQLNSWSSALRIPTDEWAQLTSLDQKKRRINSEIGDKDILLVLDDVWESEQTSDFFVGGRKTVRILSTQFLSVAIDLTTDASPPIEVPELSAEDSYTLLHALAPKAVEQDPSAVRELVRKVGGVPFALDIIGKHLKAASHKLRHTESIQAAFSLLGSIEGRREVILDKLIGTIYDQLSQPTQNVLRLLTVFPAKPNTFSEEAALAVALSESTARNLSEDALNALSDNGLLEYSLVEERLTLHQMVHDYAASITDQNLHLPYQHMLTFYSAEVRQRGDEWRTTLKDHANLSAALEHADNAGILESIIAFYPYMEANGFHQFAWNYLCRTMRWLTDREASCLVPDRDAKLSIVLLYMGRTLCRKGEFREAVQYFRDGLAAATASGDKNVESEIKHWIVIITIHLGEWDRSLRQGVQDEIAWARLKKDKRLEWRLLFEDGVLAYLNGDIDGAVARLEESMAIGVAIKSFDGRTLPCVNLCDILLFTGATTKYRYEDIAKMLRECLDQAIEAGHKDRQAYCLAIKGLLETALCQTEAAEEDFRESLALTKATNHQYLQSLALLYRGDLYLTIHKLDLALADYKASLKIALIKGYREHEALTLFSMSKVSLANGNLDKARTLGLQSEQIFEEKHHFLAKQVANWMAANSL